MTQHPIAARPARPPRAGTDTISTVVINLAWPTVIIVTLALMLVLLG